ncbi:MAG TPA: hypothetical protein VMW30_04950 [Candidatus Paceibacterota bacterium]|nr:hypothetical protein [Candidatus Paceibacterota bacterium]
MKRLPTIAMGAALALALAGLTPFSYAVGTNSPGTRCVKVGAIAKSGAVQVKCVKSGKNLIWQKKVKPKTTRKTPAPITSAGSVKPTPSKSQTSPAIPVVQSEYTVNAKGVAWSWSFTYQLDGTNSVLVSDSSHSAVLFIPQGKLVHINLKSNDVSHGFWIPGLGIDKEASPDSVGRIDIMAEKAGIFPGACNIQCGRGHAGMKLSVQVVTEMEYLKYLSTLK